MASDFRPGINDVQIWRNDTWRQTFVLTTNSTAINCTGATITIQVRLGCGGVLALTASDIVAQLRYQLFDFYTNESNSMVFFKEETPELLSGVRLSVAFEIPYDADRCAVPTTFTY